MTTLKIYKLHFNSPLHISGLRDDGGVSLRTIQSDTLYAAIIATLAKVGTEIPQDGDLGFTLSSTFPYYQRTEDSTPTYFLPMPLQTQLPQLKDVSKAKKVKKVQWVDSKLYDKVLAGFNFFDDTEQYIPFIQNCYLSEEVLPKDANGSSDFIKSEVSQRVLIASRNGEEDALPYYIDKITFSDMSGLYFLAVGNTDLLDKAIELLAQEGLGTDRNVGMGFFDVQKDKLNMQLPQEAHHQMCLSMLIPESEQQLHQLLSSDQVAYDFTRRGGWITTYPYNTLRKNAIYAFMPGSVFNKTDGDELSVVGKMVNLVPGIAELAPTHPIWRNGKSIMLPIRLK